MSDSTGQRTSSAVEVSKIQDISSAAERRTASADWGLALLKGSGSGDGGGSESDDGEELHIDGWFEGVIVVVGMIESLESWLVEE